MAAAERLYALSIVLESPEDYQEWDGFEHSAATADQDTRRVYAFSLGLVEIPNDCRGRVVMKVREQVQTVPFRQRAGACSTKRFL